MNKTLYSVTVWVLLQVESSESEILLFTEPLLW